jgi:hypothetical protein
MIVSPFLLMNRVAAALTARMAGYFEMFVSCAVPWRTFRTVSVTDGSVGYSISWQKAQIGIWLILMER